MGEIKQWWDMVDRLRGGRPSRMLRRQLESWLFGREASGSGVDLATAAVQAETAMLRGRVPGSELLPALLTLALGEDVIAAHEAKQREAVSWQPTLELLARRFAWMALQKRPQLADELEALRAELVQELLLQPMLERLAGWTAEAGRCEWVGLGRVPGLFVLRQPDRGLVADVCVLVQRGGLGRPGLTAEVRFGRASAAARLSAESATAVRLGTLLGVLAHELLQREPRPARRRRQWRALLGALELAPEQPEPDDRLAFDEDEGPELAAVLASGAYGSHSQGLGPAVLELTEPDGEVRKRSELVRSLWDAGTRLEVAVGLGGLRRLEGHSLAVAVAAATEAALAGRDFGRHAPWDLAVTGGLDGKGRLLPVGGLSSKTEAVLQSRVRGLIGPGVNAPALRELRAGLATGHDVLVRPATDVLAVVGLRPSPPALPFRKGPLVRVGLATALVIGLAFVALWRSGTFQEDSASWPEISGGTLLVAWPSKDERSSISPDQRWISFLSDRDETQNIWLTDIGRHEPRKLTDLDSGKVYFTAWSPDSQEIAYLNQRGDGEVTLEITGLSGGLPRLVRVVPLEGAALVRWLGRRIYLCTDDGLWVFDLEQDSFQERLAPEGFQMIRGIDVDVAERKAIFAGWRRGQADLWLAELETGGLWQLTDDAVVEEFPRWADRDGKSVIYYSNQTGELNLWRRSLRDGSKRQLTLSGADERFNDISADGSILTFQRIEESSHLFQLDLRSGKETQLTVDSFLHFWPSTDRDGKLLAFQQRMPGAKPGDPIGVPNILIASMSDRVVRGVVETVTGAYWPRFSPDGVWLTYLRDLPDAGSPPSEEVDRAELHLLESRSRETVKLPGRFRRSLIPHPLAWTSSDLVWNADSTALYFVTGEGSEASAIRRFRPYSQPPGSDVLVSETSTDAILGDLALLGDRSLAYLRRSGAKQQIHQILLLDLETGASSLLAALDLGGRAARWSLKGCRRDGSLILLSFELHGGLWRVQPHSLGLDGSIAKLGDARIGIPFTARLSPDGEWLYMTSRERGIYNIERLDLELGEWARLTENDAVGPIYSGVELSSTDRIVFFKHDRNWNIWTMRFEQAP
jgi:Tol biopolymer transport system component